MKILTTLKKIEVDEISFELECQNAGGSQYNKAIFKLSINLEDSKKKVLYHGYQAEGSVEISLKGNNGESLWPKELSGILIKKNRYGSSLSVDYHHLKEIQRNGDVISQRGISLNNDLFEVEKFICNFGGAVRGDSERELYRGGYLKGSTSMLLSNTNTPWTVHISIDKCDKVDNLSEMKQTTCNLKVTDGNNLKINQLQKRNNYIISSFI